MRSKIAEQSAPTAIRFFGALASPVGAVSYRDSSPDSTVLPILIADMSAPATDGPHRGSALLWERIIPRFFARSHDFADLNRG